MNLSQHSPNFCTTASLLEISFRKKIIKNPNVTRTTNITLFFLNCDGIILTVVFYHLLVTENTVIHLLKQKSDQRVANFTYFYQLCTFISGAVDGSFELN